MLKYIMMAKKNSDDYISIRYNRTGKEIEALDERSIVKPFRGFPIALITAGLMAIAFMGFSGFSI